MSNISLAFLTSVAFLTAAIITAFFVVNTPVAILAVWCTAAIVFAIWSLRE